MLTETKLYLPPAGPHLITRSALLARLNEGLARRLTLVSAPAGSGKTMLIAAWLRRLQARVGNSAPLATAWLSLDAGDDDPSRLFAHVAAALSRCANGCGDAALDLLRSDPQASATTLVRRLSNELASHDGRIVLALDDYHHVTAQAVHDAISLLLQQLPPSLHLVLITRSDPPLPVARLRARGEIQEIRGPHLRFSLSETGAFLQKALGQPLAERDVAALVQRTEGWAAGLQLASLSLQRLDNPGAFIAGFSGRHPDVFDYLVQEVLQRQEPHVRRFLLQTSVLPRLNAALCNAVSGRDDAGALLHELYRANLFLTPLDGEHVWYRYHPLFAEALRQQLRAAGLAAERALRRRAAAWFAQADEPEDAVAQALSAGDSSLVADLIARFGERMWTGNRAHTLLGWLNTLPADVLQARPYLGLLRAWSMWLTSRWDAVAPALAEAEASLRAARQSETDLPPKLSGIAAAIRANLALSERQPADAARYARTALQDLPADNFVWRAIVAQVSGDSFRALGDWQAAVESYDEAVKTGRATHNIYTVLSAMRSRAELWHIQGRLQAAEAAYRRALALAQALNGSQLTATANVHIWLGRLLCERHELDEAEGHLEQGIAICQPQEYGVGLIMAHAELAQLHSLRGDSDAAWSSLREAQKLGQILPLDSMQPYLHRVAAQLQLLEATERGSEQALQAVAAWAQRRGYTPDTPFAKGLQDATLYAHLLVAQGQYAVALESLARWQEQAQSCGRMDILVRLLSLEALAFAALGRRRHARERLLRALDLAAPEQLVRPFLAAGGNLTPLLRETSEQAAAAATAAFAGRLEAILAAHAARQRPGANEAAISFTARERDLIPLLAAGLSNRQIAEQLVVAESTVKTHLHNIYHKLSAGNRTQAVAHLREHNLL